MDDMPILCIPCGTILTMCTLVTGKDIYPHSKRLAELPFWRCNACGHYIGCHPRTTNPLGCIVSSPVKKARQEIHEVLDQIWQIGSISRSQLYKQLSERLGWTYHTANVRNIKEAKQILEILSEYKIKMDPIEGDFE